MSASSRPDRDASGPGTFADSATIFASNPSRLPREAIVTADVALQHPGQNLVKLTSDGLHCGGGGAPLLGLVFQGRPTNPETQRL